MKTAPRYSATPPVCLFHGTNNGDAVVRSGILPSISKKGSGLVVPWLTPVSAVAARYAKSFAGFGGHAEVLVYWYPECTLADLRGHRHGNLWTVFGLDVLTDTDGLIAACLKRGWHIQEVLIEQGFDGVVTDSTLGDGIPEFGFFNPGCLKLVQRITLRP
jgi:hypothetical protein